jgi:hypothetical protein
MSSRGRENQKRAVTWRIPQGVIARAARRGNPFGRSGCFGALIDLCMDCFASLAMTIFGNYQAPALGESSQQSW